MTFKRTAIIFDLDGTLVDSVPDLRLAANRVLVEAGRRELTDTEVALMVGDGVPKLVERIFTATGPALSSEDHRSWMQAFLDIYESCPMDNTKLWPGVAAALDALLKEGCHLGVCTNKPYQASIKILETVGINDCFCGIVGGDSTDRKKPDPKPLLTVIAAMGATPEQAVMVGDSPNDMEVARNAGIPGIAISFGYSKGVPPQDLGADILIHSYAELLPALRKIKA